MSLILLNLVPYTGIKIIWKQPNILFIEDYKKITFIYHLDSFTVHWERPARIQKEIFNEKVGHVTHKKKSVSQIQFRKF